MFAPLQLFGLTQREPGHAIIVLRGSYRILLRKDLKKATKALDSPPSTNPHLLHDPQPNHQALHQSNTPTNSGPSSHGADVRTESSSYLALEGRCDHLLGEVPWTFVGTRKTYLGVHETHKARRMRGLSAHPKNHADSWDFDVEGKVGRHLKRGGVNAVTLNSPWRAGSG